MPLTRLTARTAHADRFEKFFPHDDSLPALPPLDWAAIDGQPPELLSAPADTLPEADAVVITWAESEWAALEHVFVRSNHEMPYEASHERHWSEWQSYDRDMPPYGGSDSESWDSWGSYRLVKINDRKVLLFKSNTHLDWPGQRYLEDLIYRIARDVRPRLLLSIGTAGGSRLHDHLGTVNVVNAGALYDPDTAPSDWPTYAGSFAPNWSIIEKPGFGKLLFPIPATPERLRKLADGFNAHYGTDYPLRVLNPGRLNDPTPEPVLNDLTPQKTALLTTATFVVGNTSGQYAGFACIEMDDAVIGKVCREKGVSFAFVRNLSDPAQNAELPTEVQGNWGSAVYDLFGFYTSYNGALAAWAILAAEEG
jgi:nucleoside phosphorylase